MPRDLDLANSIYFNPKKGTLNLGTQMLDAEDFQKLVIPFLKQHPEVTSLDLSLNLLNLGWDNIEDKEAKALLLTFSNLTSLNLSRNNLGDKEVNALAAISNLTSLNLSRNKVGDEGVKVLGAMPNLTSLNLSQNNIGDEGAKMLAANPNLSTLDVSYNNIGDEGKNALKESDPIKRANFAKPVEAPSLLRLCLFAVNDLPDEQKNNLPIDLIERLKQTRQTKF